MSHSVYFPLSSLGDQGINKLIYNGNVFISSQVKKAEYSRKQGLNKDSENMSMSHCSVHKTTTYNSPEFSNKFGVGYEPNSMNAEQCSSTEYRHENMQSDWLSHTMTKWLGDKCVADISKQTQYIKATSRRKASFSVTQIHYTINFFLQTSTFYP